ncbi:4-(cytidine 5'-diphospho)-2-C-methyl-D-erythritol kinase [Shimia haliotis]|uniref:4-diphosphocytidyl-2-C-methyl-D-erythritol kinase n=1 Tax=Shimia haliotis TaxID=1280847 RepID=A0A1I4CW78_9RHOB|nr:4-(cytidine 5'-diphospho)-2-C-methyl-D-erythritol kinase [Shimia haliotis]SFK84151.1 4-diphosphocytidyl-2-C-methyl-D-erythritol kinase [Shimia haliotis]
MARTAEAFAPAKVNLTLHVTGQRADGYHLLDSLVMFADVGDKITVQAADETTVTVVGPFAAGAPTDHRNLVFQAAELLGVKAKITLEKHLPAAAGVGGGSSDAAAALRALTTLYNIPIPSGEEILKLGADVPVCLEPDLTRMAGIGEQISRLSTGCDWPMILVNPRVDVPTPKVFKALPNKNNSAMPEAFPDWSQDDVAVSWLAEQRNDLEAPAIAIEPVIGACLDELRLSRGCLLARMSGSGATCFGIFKTVALRDQALAQLRRDFPKWWIVPTEDCGVKFR